MAHRRLAPDCSYLLLLLLWFGASAAVGQPATIPLPERVLVVYNTNAPASLEVADYYVSKRGIPAANKCVIAPSDNASVDWTEFVRTIAVARITMPKAYVRLSAGRQQMPEAMQALCFLCGANSIFYGDKLLTTGNPEVEGDKALFRKLNLRPL